MRVMFYYQTFTPGSRATRLITDLQMEYVTDVFLSAVHFGRDPVTRKPYVHLNDNHPSEFEGLLADMKRIHNVRIHLMLGGAGCGLQPLVEQPDIFYPIFQKELMALFPTVHGINLDVEEGGIKEADFESFVERLRRDYPDLELSLAPVAEDLLVPPTPSPDFSHAQFLTSSAAKHISLLMVQAYPPRSFSADMLGRILSGPLPISESQVAMGMESGQLGWLHNVSAAVEGMASRFPKMAGFYDWELYGATSGWSEAVAQASIPSSSPSSYCCLS